MAEGEYPLTTKAIQEGLNDWIESMQKNLDNGRINNSGSLRQSLGNSFNTPVKITRDLVFISSISMNEYGKWVDEGRKPGTLPNLGAIFGWVRTKLPKKQGVDDESVMWAVAKSIQKNGTKATKFKSKVINDRSRKQLVKEVAKAFNKDLANNLLK